MLIWGVKEVVVNKILEGLKIPVNCSSVRLVIVTLSRPMTLSYRNQLFLKRADKQLSDNEKALVFTTLTDL